MELGGEYVCVCVCVCGNNSGFEGKENRLDFIQLERASEREVSTRTRLKYLGQLEEMVYMKLLGPVPDLLPHQWDLQQDREAQDRNADAKMLQIWVFLLSKRIQRLTHYCPPVPPPPRILFPSPP